MTEIELQNKNLAELLRLAKENPTLKILPMVGEDIVADDSYSYWTAKWGNAEIEEVYSENERIYFRSHDEDELEERAFERLKELHPTWSDLAIETQIPKEIESYDWEKVILVYISSP